MKFDPNDVNCSSQSSSGGKEGKFAREMKLTSCIITLTHRPTGLEVEGDIPPGNYSKKKMQRLREELKQQLMSELEEQVTKLR